MFDFGKNLWHVVHFKELIGYVPIFCKPPRAPPPRDLLNIDVNFLINDLKPKYFKYEVTFLEGVGGQMYGVAKILLHDLKPA